MPLSYAIYSDLRLVMTTGSGVVTFAESQDQQDRFTADPDFNPEFNQLLDLTAVTQFKMTASQAASLARRKLFTTLSRRAFVVSTDAIYGIARLMQAHNALSSNPSAIAVFHDMAPALEWLGLDKLP